MNRVIIGVPHCRFMVTKTTTNEKVLELTEYFAVHKHTQDEVLGLAIKAVDYHDNKGGYHRTVEILKIRRTFLLNSSRKGKEFK